MLEKFYDLLIFLEKNPIDFVLGLLAIAWVAISFIFLLGLFGIKKLPLPFCEDLSYIQDLIANQYIKSLIAIAGLLFPVLCFYEICPYDAFIYSPKDYGPKEALYFVKKEFKEEELERDPISVDGPSYRYHLQILPRDERLASPECIGTLLVSFYAACYSNGRASGHVEIYVDGKNYETVKIADEMSSCIHWNTFGDINNYKPIKWNLPLNTKVSSLYMEIDVGDYGLSMRKVEVKNSCSNNERLGLYLLKRLFGRC